MDRDMCCSIRWYSDRERERERQSSGWKGGCEILTPKKNMKKNYNKRPTNLPHEFSSEPSVQSFSPLQKRPRSIQLPSPQARKPSWHSGSSVISSGFTLRSLFLNLQFFTASFQSHVCFSMSKYSPAGQRIACRPCLSRELIKKMRTK